MNQNNENSGGHLEHIIFGKRSRHFCLYDMNFDISHSKQLVGNGRKK